MGIFCESRSARTVAVLRAMHQRSPVAKRIHDDTYAVPLIAGTLGDVIARSTLGARCIERLQPGAAAQIAARDHFADRWARQILRGPSQALLVGAGFDSMTLRLLSELPETVFFEIDLKSTQETKIQRLAARNLVPPSHRCRFVSSDFNQNDLLTRLPESGFDSRRVTFANWMGVSYYLPLAAIEQMLQVFRELLAPGSVVALDYLGEEVATRRSLLRALLRTMGESIHTQFTDAAVMQLADRNGFEIAQLTTTAEIARGLIPSERGPSLKMRLAALRRCA
jgi:methyltransferase (TIGR00027 family)